MWEGGVEVVLWGVGWRRDERLKSGRMVVRRNGRIKWVGWGLVEEEKGEKVMWGEGEGYIGFWVFEKGNMGLGEV